MALSQGARRRTIGGVSFRENKSSKTNPAFAECGWADALADCCTKVDRHSHLYWRKKNVVVYLRTAQRGERLSECAMSMNYTQSSTNHEKGGKEAF